MPRSLAASCLALLAGLAVLSGCGSTGTQVTSTRVPSLAGKAASFDDLEIDQRAHLLYVADRTDQGIDVFDLTTPSAHYVKTIALPAAPSGLAVAPDLGRVFAGLADGTVAAVDTRTGKVAGTYKTGVKAVDLLDYSAPAHLLLAGIPAAGRVAAIDTDTGKVLSTASFGKPVEQPRYDFGTRSAYVSVPDLDALVRFDPASGVIGKQIKLGGCIPRGLAIDSGANAALVACRRSVMSVDLATGATQAFTRFISGDVVSYNATVDRFFVAAPSAVGMFGGAPTAMLSLAVIPGGGSAAAYDEANDVVYTTDPGPASAGLVAFHMEGTRPVPQWQTLLTTLGPFLIIVLAALALWVFIGRMADPIHRRRPPEVSKA